jgi:hypothetical protein
VGVTVGAIQNGAPSIDGGPYRSEFLNQLMTLKPGQFFTVSGVNRNCVYQRLVYAQFKYGKRGLMRKINSSEFQIFLPGKAV